MSFKRKLVHLAHAYLSADQAEFLSRIYRNIELVFLRYNFLLTNRSRIKRANKQHPLKLHVGCGNKRLDGYINVDMVAGRNVDILVDLNIFRFNENSCEVIFSNAFFEHISMSTRVEHLKGALRSLKRSGGVICYIGIPYFKKIAELYLKREDGPGGYTLDANRLCKFTHGGTTMEIIERGVSYVRSHPTYLYAELHKALYDEHVLHELLDESGFPSYVIFLTEYPKDKMPIGGNIGFYASNIVRDKGDLKRECEVYLQQFDKIYLNSKRIRFFTHEDLGCPK